MQSQASTRTRKLGARATPYVFAFYMSSIMAMLMCFVITAANSGIGEQYLSLSLIHI